MSFAMPVSSATLPTSRMQHRTIGIISDLREQQ
eukprot:CAMPEP_0117577620 /NCGR_PEP_ID=MMETSP0784-20121206/63522_1 /TAXON_ID=39447 /ORGANISM="" /LENGTH=32 /DNA_ID= /DNA_START= /DNA_END= /DNA_ORIENTATION=